MRFGSFSLSFLLHALVFAAILLWPSSPRVNLDRPPAYQISLVSGAPGGEGLSTPLLGHRPVVTPDTPSEPLALPGPEGAPLEVAQAPVPETPAPPPEAVPAPQVASQPQPLPTPPPVESGPTPSPAVAIPSQPPEVRRPEDREDAARPEPERPEPDPLPQPAPEPQPTPEEPPAEQPRPEETPEPPAREDPPPRQDLPPRTEPSSRPPQRQPNRDPIGDALRTAENQASRPSGSPQTSGSAAAQALAGLEAQGVTPRAGTGGGGGTGSGPGGGGAPASLDEIYAISVGDAIKVNWNRPAFGRDNIVATVIVRIGPDGTIVDYNLERSSGRTDFDSSVMLAVERTGSVPRPPRGTTETITINFNLFD